jgi:hypothetical protein
MYLGTTYISTKSQPDRTSNMAARWPSLNPTELLTRNLDQISVQSDSWLGHLGAKTKDTRGAMTPELMAGSSSCTLSGWGRVQLIEYASENVHNFERPLTALYLS